MVCLPRFPLCCVGALLFVACGGGGGGGATVDSEGSTLLAEAGIEQLDQASSSSLLEAYASFEEALTLDPGNDLARSMLALTEALVFFDQPNTAFQLQSGSSCGLDLETLLNRLEIDLVEGTTIFTLLDGTAPSPEGPEGDLFNPPTGTELQSFFRCELIPMLQSVATHLEEVDFGFTYEFESGLFSSGGSFSLDAGDARAAAGALRVFEMALHKACLFELAGKLSNSKDGMPSQLFTGNGPLDVIPEQVCKTANRGLFNSYEDYGTEGLLDVSAEGQTHLNGWREAAIQVLENINDAVDAKNALEAAGAVAGLFEIDPDFSCAQPVWLPWLTQCIDALSLQDPFVPAVEGGGMCGFEVDLPEGYVSPRIFELATYANRPFLPTYTFAECYDVSEASFSHIDSPTYANLRALAADYGADLSEEDLYNFWVDRECNYEWEQNGGDWEWTGCGLGG
jgi:hypothetical protein